MSNIQGLQLSCTSKTAIQVAAGQITQGGQTLVLGQAAQIPLPANPTPHTTLAVWLVSHNGQTQPRLSGNFQDWTGPGQGARIGTAWIGGDGKFTHFQQTGAGDKRSYELGGPIAGRTWIKDGQSTTVKTEARHWTLAPSIVSAKLELSCGGPSGSASIRNRSNPQQEATQAAGGTQDVVFTIAPNGGAVDWWTTGDGLETSVIVIWEELI